MNRREMQRAEAERSYVCELAHCIGFNGDVVLLELLLDLVDAGGDILGLKANKGEAKVQTPDQFRQAVMTGKADRFKRHYPK